jgi:autotransporter-associated beta strand protein
MKSNRNNRLLLAAITLAGFAFAAPTVHAATYSWTQTVAGPFNWDNASAQNNWTSGFPNAVGDVAIMNVNLTANQTVNLNQAITVGSLTFGDSNNTQTATLATGTAGSLTFDATSGNASLIRTAGGTAATTISAPITLKDNLAVSLASGTAASTMNLSGIISESGGAKSLIKDSSTLTLALSGANTFSGGVTILSGTVDSKVSSTTLGSGTLVIGGSGGVNPVFQTGVNNANAVQVNANTTGTSIIAANGIGSGTVMSGGITLNSANLNVRTFSAGTTAGVTLSGGVTGTGNLLINNLSDGTAATGKVTLSGSAINNIGTVTSQGTGPTANVISAVIGANVTNVIQNSATTGLNLTAVNLYTGSTTITAGTLQISGSGKLNNGNYAGEISIATSSTLRYSSSAAQTFSGNITGLGALAKDTGTASKLILSGTNTYTGATTVSAGTLAVNGSLANTTTTVGSGGTLQGSGSITGSVTVQNGGTLATGNSIASLATGALSLQAGSTFAYEIDNGAAAGVAGDLTAVTGTLTIDLGNAAILMLSELGSGSWSAGEKLTLISYSGAWNGGLFSYNSSALADDSTINFSSMEWLFNYNDTAAGTNYTGDLTGTSYVTMTAIPEPNVAALLGGLGTLLLLRRRR